MLQHYRRPPLPITDRACKRFGTDPLLARELALIDYPGYRLAF
jgi:hypothetical protein